MTELIPSGQHAAPDASEPFLAMFTAWQEFITDTSYHFSHIDTAERFVGQTYVLTPEQIHEVSLEGLRAALSFHFAVPEHIEKQRW